MEEVDRKFVKFVTSFVFIFERRLKEYSERLDGQITKPGKSADSANEIMNFGKSGVDGIPIPGSKIATAVVASAFQKATSKLGKKYSEDHVKLFSDQILFFNENSDKLREDLIVSGIKIFQNFEAQFVKVTKDGIWQRAMIKLAEDAISRALNFHKNNSKELSVQSITKGVILGKSKKYDSTSIKPGHTLESNNSKLWNTAKIFEATGIVIPKSNNIADTYYIKKDDSSKTKKYGYRLSFDYENINDYYKKANEIDYRKYKYLKKTCEISKLFEIIKDEIIVLDKSPLSTKKFEKEIEEQKKDASQNFNKLTNIENNCKELLIFAKNGVELINRLSEDLKRVTIAKEDKEGNREIKESLNHVKEDQNKIIEQNSSSEQYKGKKNTPVLFEVKNSVASFTGRGVELGEIKESLNHAKEGQNKIIEKNSISEQYKGKKNKPILFEVRDSVASFTGRGVELGRIAASIKRGTVVITGMGGLGKSELAIKYAHSYHKQMEGNVIWINAETLKSVKHSFCKLLKKLGIKTKYSNGDAKSVQHMSEEAYHFFSTSDALFIFDNVVTFATIYEFLPKIPAYHTFRFLILITTRNIQLLNNPLHGKYEDINLDVLPIEAAICSVKNCLGIEDTLHDKDITELVNVFGCLPLALQHATACIKESGYAEKIGRYVKLYTSSKGEMKYFLNRETLSSYDKTIYLTFHITIEKVKKEDKGNLAFSILKLLAYFAPKNIPSELFLQLAEDRIEISDDSIQKEEEEIKDESINILTRAINLLAKYSIIKHHQGQIDIHKLVQLVVQSDLKMVKTKYNLFSSQVDRNQSKEQMVNDEANDEIVVLQSALKLIENYIAISAENTSMCLHHIKSLLECSKNYNTLNIHTSKKRIADTVYKYCRLNYLDLI